MLLQAQSHLTNRRKRNENMIILQHSSMVH